MKSKIHRVFVTDANLNYNGSISIDPVLMERADIREFEKVLVVNLNNGERFETYAIHARSGSGDVCVNGAAARLVQIGDILLIMTFALMEEGRLDGHQPKIVHVDPRNFPSG